VIRLRRGGRLVVASHNPGKVREIEALLAPFGVAAMGAAELGLPEPEETEPTFAGNARIKAEAAATGANLPALADDSGLCVSALGGAPGVYSARWAGPGKDFAVGMARIDKELGGNPDKHAMFVCALALAAPGQETEIFEGRVFGALTFPPRGMKGFGYDPIFVPEGHRFTFGEMDPDAKHAISHRAKAFEKFARAVLG
jgi:XTP/dITP diphosphohydrolase